MINLGDRVKDRISGVQGVVTGRTEFLYGCVRLSVAPEEFKDGKPAETLWIDEPQCQLVKARVGAPFDRAAAEAAAGPRPDAVRTPDVRR